MQIRTGTAGRILSSLLLAVWVLTLGAAAVPCQACCCCQDDAPAPSNTPVFAGCGCDMSSPVPSQAAAEQIVNPAGQLTLVAFEAAPAVRIAAPAASFATARALPRISPSPPRASSTILQI